MAASAFEQERQARIAANKRRLQELGVIEAREELEAVAAACCPAPKRRARKEKADVPEAELRRSGRERAPINYCEEPLLLNDRLPGERAERKVVYLDRGDLDASLFASPRVRSNHDSGRGVRIQGGRVYDSKMGVTCHWCRQKTLENKVTCTHPGCGGGRRLPTSFCGMCLRNRHGEEVTQAEASGKWVCPGCRGGCGDGCTLCCNCGPCRKKAGLAPTHQVVKEARTAGFSNVHDYLVHQRTGEHAAAIEARKERAAWGAWLRPDGPAAAAAAPEPAAEEAAGGPVDAAAGECEQQTVDGAFASVKAAPAGAAARRQPRKGRRGASGKARALRSVGLAAPAPGVACC